MKAEMQRMKEERRLEEERIRIQVIYGLWNQFQ